MHFNTTIVQEKVYWSFHCHPISFSTIGQRWRAINYLSQLHHAYVLARTIFEFSASQAEYPVEKPPASSNHQRYHLRCISPESSCPTCRWAPPRSWLAAFILLVRSDVGLSDCQLVLKARSVWRVINAQIRLPACYFLFLRVPDAVWNNAIWGVGACDDQVDVRRCDFDESCGHGCWLLTCWRRRYERTTWRRVLFFTTLRNTHRESQ